MRLPALLLALALAGCLSPSAASPDVVASFYPLQYLAERIAGGHLSVGSLVPAGAEPHDYDLKPSDQASLSKAKLVVFQGPGLEAFLAKAQADARARGIPFVVASEGIPPRNGSEGLDPHAWLDPVEAQTEATNVERGLEKADPANAQAYRDNLAALLGDLRTLDQAYRAGLAHCVKPRIITTHAAFGHLAARYNFTQYAISGFEPDAEPSAQKIQETADLARRENVTTIFFETLVSPRVAQVVADEIHGRTEVLDPIEGITPEGAARGETYLTLMLENLDHLRDAMECS